MAFDALKNFPYSTVATAPSPATSGTSLVVATGDGAAFPAVPFNATVWPAGAQPTNANAEIVRVTGISTDTLTITRTQEGTSARTIVTGDQIAATITKKTLTDIQDRAEVLLYDSGEIGASTGTLDSGAGGFSTAYHRLKIIAYLRNTSSGDATVRFNNDSGANYSWGLIDDHAAATLAGNNAVAQTSIAGPLVAASTTDSHEFSLLELEVFDYANTGHWKNAKGRTFRLNLSNVTLAVNFYSYVITALWASASAINRVQVIAAAGQFDVGSRLLVYGIPL